MLEEQSRLDDDTDDTATEELSVPMPVGCRPLHDFLATLPGRSSVPSIDDVYAKVAVLTDLHKQNSFSITSRMGVDSALGAFIRRNVVGWNKDDEEGVRKKKAAQALALIKSLYDENKAILELEGKERTKALAMLQSTDPIAGLVITSKATAEPWLGMESLTEREMIKIMKTLPVAPFVESVRGFGWMSAARILGVSGPLDRFHTVRHFWKRLGLAVIDGRRQRRVADAELALVHGYSPIRRSVSWNVFQSVRKAQWRGATEDAPARPIGPYGEIYGRAKIKYMARVEEGVEGWTKGRAENAAMRYAEKYLMADFYTAWKRSIA